jgi:hypothetical protein
VHLFLKAALRGTQSSLLLENRPSMLAYHGGVEVTLIAAP